MTPTRTQKHINRLIRHLVLKGLADDHQEAFVKRSARIEVTFQNASLVSFALGRRPYSVMYEYFAENRVFNVRMLDGAFIQMTYLFQGKNVTRHRLVYYPSPYGLVDWDDDLVGRDSNFIGRNWEDVQPVPIRFDYDADSDKHIDVLHPKSHLTLGNYSECRIPVTCPVTPYWFFYFVIGNFYSSTSASQANDLPRLDGTFRLTTLTSKEELVPHLAIPA